MVVLRRFVRVSFLQQHYQTCVVFATQDVVFLTQFDGTICANRNYIRTILCCGERTMYWRYGA